MSEEPLSCKEIGPGPAPVLASLSRSLCRALGCAALGTGASCGCAGWGSSSSSSVYSSSQQPTRKGPGLGFA